MEIGLPGPADAPVPFYFHRRGVFQRIQLAPGNRGALDATSIFEIDD